MHDKGLALLATLPDGRLPDHRSVEIGPAAMQDRVRELETLCAEVYLAAVELGLPQTLLNRLWTVAAHGCSPHAFVIEMPPRAPAAPPAGAAPVTEGSPDGPAPSATPAPDTPAANAPSLPAPVHAMPMQIPDIRLTDRPRSADTRPRATGPELTALSARRTVLVVDDDAMMLEVLVRILQRENYELLIASGGPEALRMAEAFEGQIDLLITDYAMPDMKGHELAEHMRGRYTDIKVLYQTGFSDMLFENRVELEEGSAFLEKPFTARGLREAARFILFGVINP